VLIATESGTGRISHVSDNLTASLGVPASCVIGTELDAFAGPAAFGAIQAALEDASYPSSNVLKLTLPVPVRPRRKALVHRHAGRTIVELEDAPLRDEAGLAVSKAQNIITGLRRAQTVSQLCNDLAQQIRQMTGFDRVMIYRFDAAGHGSVIAEDKAERLSPYLHLRYPASDIPQQARRLYMMQRIRAIPDARYRPVDLLSSDGSELDMSFCTLRGISPVHLEYMGNMGVRASLTVSLVVDDQFWGMICCHHMTPRIVCPEMRALCDMIGQFVSVLLMRVAELETLAGRMGRYGRIVALHESIIAAGGIAEGLCRPASTILDLAGAGGALIRFDGQTRLVGDTPPLAACDAMLERVLQTDATGITALADAGKPGGVAEGFAAEASGLLVLPMIDHPGDVIAWFRPELARTVIWAGDPNKMPEPAPDGERLSPRTSFAAWTEMQRGCSETWSAVDVQVAADLRRAIARAMLRQAEMQLADLSARDPLTGLANRRAIQAELDRWRLKGGDSEAALLFIDLDRFKSVNDVLGHEAGDHCLIELATRLRQLAPEGSVAGRFGGDEFVVFWPGAGADAAKKLADALVAESKRKLTWRDRTYFASVSVGVACATTSRLDVMMRQADAAMYAAKRRGGGRAVMFEPHLHDVVLQDMQTEQELYHAVERKELEVHYQPLICVASRHVCGFEALVRWRHPIRGWVSPDEFIPRAEEAGLIGRFGMWVLSRAVLQLAAWRSMAPGITMSVNISPLQLTDETFADRLSQLLTRAFVPPSALCLEVTETALIEPSAIKELQDLRLLGVKIAIDDFGIGHSSLGYLQSLPADAVKIDKSFVRPLGQAKADRFFAAIVDLARTVDLQTVAEGCETIEQWRVIQASGCDKMQGWLAAPAMDCGAAERFLLAGSKALDLPQIEVAPAADCRVCDGTGLAAPKSDCQVGRVIDDEGLDGRDVYFAAVTVSRMAMALVDPNRPDMPVIFVNEAFERLTLYDRSEILGRNCRFLQGPDSDGDAVRQIRQALQARREVTAELINYRKDGTSFWNVVHISPVFNEAGRLVYFVSSQADVSQRRWN
jgi:diguanylate cyclase (GGDEF)-like protein/PAS domain S-box-containing protein